MEMHELVLPEKCNFKGLGRDIWSERLHTAPAIQRAKFKVAMQKESQSRPISYYGWKLPSSGR